MSKCQQNMLLSQALVSTDLLASLLKMKNPDDETKCNLEVRGALSYHVAQQPLSNICFFCLLVLKLFIFKAGSYL